MYIFKGVTNSGRNVTIKDFVSSGLQDDELLHLLDIRYVDRMGRKTIKTSVLLPSEYEHDKVLEELLEKADNIINEE